MSMRNRLWKPLRLTVALSVFFAACAAFSGFCAHAAFFLHAQAAPAVLACLASFSVGALAAVVVLAVSALLFGRIYCGAFCPFGILQDVVDFASRRKSAPVPNFAKTRLLIFGLSCGMLIAGWTAPFLLLDPYSNFGRIGAMIFSLTFSIGAATPLLVVAALAVWKKRLFCTTICPVGTALGLLSKHSVFRLRLTDRCVGCGTCVSVCPAGCIDLNRKSLDPERCLRCMNCIAACKLSAIHFSMSRPFGKADDAIPFSESRRAFFINGTVLFAGLAAGVVLAKAGTAKLLEFARSFRILPPGAGDAERFISKCTACQLCTMNCPQGIIVPAPGGDGPVSIDFSKGFCKADCNLCSRICPTGAIRPVSLETKKKTKIAEAKFNPRVCIVFQEGTPCGRCARACPTGAIALRKTGAPRLNPKLCIGCGACQFVCPAEEKAMRVEPIESQILLPQA